jgi:methyl-accepting chemotaxis protein
LDDIRSLLHALADRLATSLTTAPSEAREPDALDEKELVALRAALDAIARGDLVHRPERALPEPKAERIIAAMERVRTLVRAATEASGAASRAGAIIDAVERAATAGNHQRLALDRSSDELRPLTTRLDDLAQEAAELAATGDRIALLALNTGIEGLRVGGEVARALGGLGDEIRRLALRTALSAREIGESLRASAELTQRAMASLEDARAALRQIADEVTRAAASAESVRVADDALTDAAKAFRVLDIESDALVSRLDEAATRLASDVARARSLAQRGDAEDVEAALARLQAIVRGE